jgi:PAS domain S-box-containing protein
VDTAHDAFVAMDARGVICGWNRQAEATFGWSRAEAMGRPLAPTIIPPAYREAHDEGLRRFLATGEGPVLNKRIEVAAVRRDGSEFPVELTIAPIRLGEGPLFAAFVRDITERKRAESQLREAKEAAEAASKAKSEFLANMSHEIRTPMNGILGMTELALDTELTREQRDYLTLVRVSAESLMAVIDDILDFSKIEAQKLTLDERDFSLRDGLGDTLKALALRAQQKGLELACHIPPEVPDALRGDPGRLRQVIVNLVGNAIKFTQAGEVVVEVTRAGGDGPPSDGCLLEFSVRDTGIGIPPEKLGLIFEAFAQADGSTTREYGGTGLGLTISSRLVELMGGRVWVESEVGRGSTFRFTARFGPARGSAASAGLRRPEGLHGLSVLVVDDNATNRQILEEMLANWRMRPTAVDGGPAALARMKQAAAAGEPFALVLLDAMMPGMDGFALAEEIGSHPELAGAVLMMLSSAGRPEDGARCRALGIGTYLTKPVKQSELLDAILTALDAAAVEEPPPPAEEEPPAAGRRLRVLLAEDNPVNQRLAVGLLERQGHAVVVAGNGREAVAALEADRFDVVLMDVQMPEMGGLEATQAVRAREAAVGRHTPIIAMTAHAMKGDRERCLEAGMDDYVSKPVRAQDLYDALGRVAPQGPPEPETIDRAELLDRVGGDEELMREIVGVFLDSCPGQFAELRQAVERRDARVVHRLAHTLKGSVGQFGARSAHDAAVRLELIGKSGDLAQADEAFAALRGEVERVRPALEALLREGGSSGGGS